MFLTKKIVSALLYPLMLGLLLMSVGLLFARSRWRGARRLALLGLLLILVPALPAIATLAARSLEAYYQPVDTHTPTAARAIVVLSGGSFTAAGGGPWERLNEASIRRVLEGVRLKRAFPDLALILSGGSTTENPPHALAMAELATWSGIAADQLELELDSRDTHDQARLLAARLGDTPFLLVTSATHMPRSLALFRALGLQPIAAPADYVDHGIRWGEANSWIPSARALATTTRSVHEWYGLVWSRLSGQL